MILNKEKLALIDTEVTNILAKISVMEEQYKEELSKVHPVYARSSKNLVHYLAFRSFDVDNLQDKLRELSLPSLSNVEGHVKDSLLNIKTIINCLQGELKEEKELGTLSISQSKKILNRNTKLLFGYKSKKRRTRIMVTLPTVAADDPYYVHHLLKAGMNSARINCAHDNAETWGQMIENLKQARKITKKKCRVMMDLGGPKLRTGSMKPGPKVIHIKPKRNALGNVVNPAKIWLAPPGINPPDDTATAILPIDEEWFARLKKGDIITFTDTRNKKREIIIESKDADGRWGVCYDSAYVETVSKAFMLLCAWCTSMARKA